MPDKAPVITIDGPSGTGKGTLGWLMAKKLGWHFLESGVLYRALALMANKQQLGLEDIAKIAQLADRLKVTFHPDDTGSMFVALNGEDVSQSIRTEQCGQLASKISAHQQVRQALLKAQVDHRRPPGLVTDGRDMGTVVFPDANVKFFLTATPKARAERRYKQLKEKGHRDKLAEIENEIVKRDERDTSRAISPLTPADDAIVIDTTSHDVQSIFDIMLAQVKTAL